jgi:putative phosphoribosyl transferase
MSHKTLSRRFESRLEAGKTLAAQLKGLPIDHPVVLAISPDAIPVAYPVAKALACPLDLVLGYKVTHPWNPDLPLGVVTERDFFSSNSGTAFHGLSGEQVRKIFIKEASRIAAEARTFSEARPQISLVDRNVVLIGEGASSGFTAHAIAEIARLRGARSIFLALPYCTERAANKLRELQSADDIFIEIELTSELSPSEWYPSDWQEAQTASGQTLFHARTEQVKTKRIIELLKRANESAIPRIGSSPAEIRRKSVA